VDLGSPDGYLLTPSGDRLPLPTSSSNGRAEPLTDQRQEASHVAGPFE
jgi:hypothetical protein